MADEVLKEEVVSEVSDNAASDAAAEAIVGQKMADIFQDNDETQQADELEQSGVTSPDNPEGHDEVVTGEAEDTVDDNKVDLAEASVEDLKAAEKAAVESGDYEKAIEIRDQIKAVAVAPKNEKQDGFDPTLKQIAVELGGWSKDDVDAFVKENPTFARITFKKMADSYNALSSQYANAARNGAPALTPPVQQNATTQQQTGSLESLYKDLEKFSEVAGSEMVERFIKPLKTDVLEPLKDVVQFVNEQRAEAVKREVLQGFEAIAKDGFEDHYGKSDQLSDKQREARQQVAQLADTIHTGAKAHGVQMSYGEAIRRAHLIQSSDKAISIARKNLVRQVKNRSTQMTQRPSQRVARVAEVGDVAAEKAVDSFWASRE
jgi:hypothetical protein